MKSNEINKLNALFLKYRDALLPITILIFLFSLIIAIFFRIDGLGIFSISGSIIFFFFLMYSRPKAKGSEGGSGGSDNLIEQNIAYFFNKALEPKYFSLLIKFFITIIDHIEKNREKLTEEQIAALMPKIENLNIELKKKALKHPEKPFQPKNKLTP